MEYILGPLVAIGGFFAIIRIVKAIDSSKSESVQQLVRMAGTLSAISLAKRALRDSIRK